MKIIFEYVFIGVLLAMFCVLCWVAERYIHYGIAYKSMVEQTVREMVKPESLK